MLEVITFIVVILLIILFGIKNNQANKRTMFRHYIQGEITKEAYEDLYPETKIK